MFCGHRGGRYGTKKTPADENQAEVIVAKNRHGGLDNVPLGWFGQFTKFSTIERREEN